MPNVASPFVVHPLSPSADFAHRLIDWQRQHGRHDLPWQQTRDPYRVWLSEIMLQQTQVLAVIPYYQRFLARFASLEQLAQANLDDVMALWSGLGYYARARNLHRCAQIVMRDYVGHFPQDPVEIARLPGIGRSTANAIAVFCFAARVPILDGNVKRILCRVYGVEGFPGVSAVEQHLWELATQLLPAQAAKCARYIQAQMDLGATLCTRSKPVCLQDAQACPVASMCVAYRTQRCMELPMAKPRKALAQRSVQVLVLWDGQRVLLERRPPTGIWGGLLSLPELPPALEASHFVRQHWACEMQAVEDLPSLRHTFTHFRLNLQPVLVQVQVRQGLAENLGYCWLDREALAEAALPTPIRKIVSHIPWERVCKIRKNAVV